MIELPMERQKSRAVDKRSTDLIGSSSEKIEQATIGAMERPIEGTEVNKGAGQGTEERKTSARGHRNICACMSRRSAFQLATRESNSGLQGFKAWRNKVLHNRRLLDIRLKLCVCAFIDRQSPGVAEGQMRNESFAINFIVLLHVSNGTVQLCCQEASRSWRKSSRGREGSKGCGRHKTVQTLGNCFCSSSGVTNLRGKSVLTWTFVNLRRN